MNLLLQLQKSTPLSEMERSSRQKISEDKGKQIIVWRDIGDSLTGESQLGGLEDG